MAYYGGHQQSPNSGRQGKRKIPGEKKKEKQAVLMMASRQGGTLSEVIPGETTDAILKAAAKYIRPDTTLYADEHAAYDALHAFYPIHRINHRWEFSRDGHVTTNRVESVHSRMRRAEMGVYNHLSGKYLDRYASEIAFRIDNGLTANGTTFEDLIRKAINHPIARDWLGCWQRRPKDA